jgi:hypothetical protein
MSVVGGKDTLHLVVILSHGELYLNLDSVLQTLLMLVRCHHHHQCQVTQCPHQIHLLE